MSEAFYKRAGLSKTEMQLKIGKYKPKRRLKTDYVKDIESLLGGVVPDLNKLTVVGLTKLELLLREKE
jgi:hypothetical protein